jgi:hypothetical protein
MSDSMMLIKTRRKRFKSALANASALHLGVGLFRLVVAPALARSESGYGMFYNRMRYREENERIAGSEYRQYAVFILVYGLMLGLYNAFGTYRMQKLAVAIETFRISCYVFVTTMDGFDFDDEMSSEKFMKQVWDLIGCIGILGNVCAVCDDP